ncbi:MAG TPA: molybdopterin molybdotransferase MoeA [Micromonosporaceae bacterium]
MPWPDAWAAAYAAGRAAAAQPVAVPLANADGLTLASALTTLTDLPAFPTSSVDGYATRGAGPWRVVGQVLAGGVPAELAPGDAVEIATGAMVPDGTEQIIRIEHAEFDADGRVSGVAKPQAEWRDPGDEAAKGEELIPAGSPVTPALIGLAAACGYDTLPVVPAARTAVVIFGDELLTGGLPGQGRVRDALGPQLPGWLARLGTRLVPGFAPRGPVEDTLPAHVNAISAALAGADLVCTTGGTMHGPVDHLHPALAELGARYVANTVAVRPGFPMLLAEVPGAGPGERPKFVAGLPGNPQSAIVALVSLVLPLLDGLAGRAVAQPRSVELAEPVPGRGDYTHLALVRLDPAGRAHPLPHAGSAMLRGLARADGFAVVAAGDTGEAGARVPFVPLPLLPGGRP